MSPSPQADEEPSVVGVRVRPGQTLALFLVLGASAGFALWAQRNPDEAPRWSVQGAPWLFLVFVVGFAAYRFALVVARRYSPFKAFFQVFVAAIFFMLLLPGSPMVQPPAGSGGEAPLGALFTDRDQRVRALAAEVAGFRGDLADAPRLVPLLDDPDALVRTRARAALVRLNMGADLGEQSAPWKDRFK